MHGQEIVWVPEAGRKELLGLGLGGGGASPRSARAWTGGAFPPAASSVPGKGCGGWANEVGGATRHARKHLHSPGAAPGSEHEGSAYRAALGPPGSPTGDQTEDTH